MVAARIILNQHYNGSPPESASTSSDAKTPSRRRVASASSDDTTLEDSPGGSFKSRKSPTSSELLETKSVTSESIGSKNSSRHEFSGRNSESRQTSSPDAFTPTSFINSSVLYGLGDFSFSGFGGHVLPENPESISFGPSGFMPPSFHGFPPSLWYKATPCPDGSKSRMDDFSGGSFEFKKSPTSSVLLEPKSEISDVILSTQFLGDESLGRNYAKSSSIDSSTPSEFANVSFSAFGGHKSSTYPGSENFVASGFVPSSFYGIPRFDATTSFVYNEFMIFGSQFCGLADTTGATDGFMNSGAATSSDHKNLRNYGYMPTGEANGYLNTNWSGF